MCQRGAGTAGARPGLRLCSRARRLFPSRREGDSADSPSVSPRVCLGDVEGKCSFGSRPNLSLRGTVPHMRGPCGSYTRDTRWSELLGDGHRGGGSGGRRQLCRGLSRGQDPPALVPGVDGVGTAARGPVDRPCVRQPRAPCRRADQVSSSSGGPPGAGTVSSGPLTWREAESPLVRCCGPD